MPSTIGIVASHYTVVAAGFNSVGYAVSEGTSDIGGGNNQGAVTISGISTVSGRLYLVVGVGVSKNSQPATMVLSTNSPTVTELIEAINSGSPAGNQRPHLVIGKFTGTGAGVDVSFTQVQNGFYADVITALEVFEVPGASGTGQVNSSKSDVGAGAFNVSLSLPGALTGGAKVFGTMGFTPFSGGAAATINPNGDGTEISERYYAMAAGTGESFGSGSSIRFMTMWDDDATLSWSASVDEYIEVQGIVEVLF